MGIGKEVGRRLGPQAHKLAPDLTTQLRPRGAAARHQRHRPAARRREGRRPAQLDEAGGDAGEAVDER